MKRLNGAAPAEPPRKAVPTDHVRVTHWNGQLTVKDAKNRDIPGIIAADVAMRPGAPPLMRLNLAAGNFDVEGLPTYGMMDPRSGRFRPIKGVEWADGTDDFEPPSHVPAPVVSPPASEASEQRATDTPTTDDPEASQVPS